MSMRLLALTALLVSAAAGPVRAEDPRPRLAAHEELRGLLDGMMAEVQALGDRVRDHFGAPSGRERPLISIMLSHRDDLALTPAQVQALERLRADFQKESVRREAEIRVAEMDIGTLLDAKPVDMAKIEAKVREAERGRADLRVSRIRIIEEGKAVLTAEQREKLAQMIAADPWPAGARRPKPTGPGTDSSSGQGRPERL